MLQRRFKWDSILLYGSAKSIVNFGKYNFMYCLKIGPSHQYGIPLAGRQWQILSLMLSFDIAFGCSKELSH